MAVITEFNVNVARPGFSMAEAYCPHMRRITNYVEIGRDFCHDCGGFIRIDSNKVTAQLDIKSIHEPIPMILYCPNCHVQHIDKPDPEHCKNCGKTEINHSMLYRDHLFTPWTNPPHRKHRCVACNEVFQISLVCTVGVERL